MNVEKMLVSIETAEAEIRAAIKVGTTVRLKEDDSSGWPMWLDKGDVLTTLKAARTTDGDTHPVSLSKHTLQDNEVYVFIG